MCELADKYNEAGEKEKRDVVRECINIVHDVFYRFNEQKYRINQTDAQPISELEEVIMEMNDLKIFEMMGGKRLYEADGRQFQSAREVIVYLIQCRREKMEGQIRQQKYDFLNEVYKLMKQIDPATALQRASWKTNGLYAKERERQKGEKK